MSDTPQQSALTGSQGHDDVENYGGGHIQAHHGTVDTWLLVVYLIMFIWALYYGVTYWGGLGPGLDI